MPIDETPTLNNVLRTSLYYYQNDSLLYKLILVTPGIVKLEVEPSPRCH